MIAPIVAFLLTPLGRWCAIFGVLILSWVGVKVHYENKGASRVIARIERKAEALNEKATEAHNAAAKPGALDRLRKRYCTDC